jgi:V/A-type H+/Na+-transporting ATPase subunit B
MPTGLGDLLRYTHATAMVGDILKIRAHDVGLADMALVEMPDGEQSLAQAIQLVGDEVSLQIFGGGEGLSTQAMSTSSSSPGGSTERPSAAA